MYELDRVGQEVQLLFQDMKDCGSAWIYVMVSSLGGPPTYWWQKREEVFPPLVPSWLKHHSHLQKGDLGQGDYRHQSAL